MQHTPDELARRALQMRPSDTDTKTDIKPPPTGYEISAPKPKMNLERDLTPEQRAKKALGLQPNDPMPEPKEMSPQMQAALAKLDPSFQVQVMGLMGCLEKFQEKTQSLSEKIQQNMGTAVERTKNTSIAQRTIIRRAQKGTLGPSDVAMASGIIAEQGARGAIDPRTEGLTEIMEQKEELMGAAKEMHALLQEQMPEGEDQFGEKGMAMAMVDQLVTQQASFVSKTADQAWGSYQQSDMLRIQEIVEGQKGVQLDQAATHRPQAG